MSIMKGKVEGGQGGKLGHSNMNHWGFTEEIKDASRKLRRHQAKRDVADRLLECEQNPNDSFTPDLTDEFSQ